MVGLNKYVARDKIDLKQFGEADVKDRTFGGELVVLPSASGVTGPALFLYWNKDHFKQVGLNPEQGPKTWAELETYAVRLMRPGERLGVNPTGRLFLWLHTNNGRFYADEGRKAGFDTPETRDALRYVSQLVQRQGVAEMEEYGQGARRSSRASTRCSSRSTTSPARWPRMPPASRSIGASPRCR